MSADGWRTSGRGLPDGMRTDAWTTWLEEHVEGLRTTDPPPMPEVGTSELWVAWCMLGNNVVGRGPTPEVAWQVATWNAIHELVHDTDDVREAERLGSAAEMVAYWLRGVRLLRLVGAPDGVEGLSMATVGETAAVDADDWEIVDTDDERSESGRVTGDGSNNNEEGEDMDNMKMTDQELVELATFAYSRVCAGEGWVFQQPGSWDVEQGQDGPLVHLRAFGATEPLATFCHVRATGCLHHAPGARIEAHGVRVEFLQAAMAQGRDLDWFHEGRTYSAPATPAIAPPDDIVAGFVRVAWWKRGQRLGWKQKEARHVAIEQIDERTFGARLAQRDGAAPFARCTVHYTEAGFDCRDWLDLA